MKRIISIIVSVLVIFCMVGCIGNSMNRKSYNTDHKLRSELKVENLGGMVNVDTNEFELKIKDDPNGMFELVLKYKDRKQKHSPESMEAIGNAGEKWIKAYNGSDAIEKIIDANSTK